MYEADALLATPLKHAVDNNYVRILRERFRARRLSDGTISVVTKE